MLRVNLLNLYYIEIKINKSNNNCILFFNIYLCIIQLNQTIMYQINDIADYIILRVKAEDNYASLINLKLQKLLYYIQAWSYGMNKKPLFDGEFQAWIHGPVNKSIYDRFNPTKYLYSEINISDILNEKVEIASEDAEFIEFVLENYLKYSGAELENLSHTELPWIKTREGVASNERCTKIIDSELMKEYYGKKWEELNKS